MLEGTLGMRHVQVPASFDCVQPSTNRSFTQQQHSTTQTTTNHCLNNGCMGIPDCNVLGRYTDTSTYSSSVTILEVLLHVRSSYGRNRKHERITRLIVGGLDELKSV